MTGLFDFYRQLIVQGKVAPCPNELRMSDDPNCWVLIINNRMVLDIPDSVARALAEIALVRWAEAERISMVYLPDGSWSVGNPEARNTGPLFDSLLRAWCDLNEVEIPHD